MHLSRSRTRIGLVVASVALVGGVGVGLAAAQADGPEAPSASDTGSDTGSGSGADSGSGGGRPGGEPSGAGSEDAPQAGSEGGSSATPEDGEAGGDAGTGTDAGKCPRGEEFATFPHGWTAGHSRTTSALVGEGSQGRHVAEAQCLLAGWGYEPGAVDGIYGPSTASAVKAYQDRNGLTKDGVVGKDTWKKLRVTSGR